MSIRTSFNPLGTLGGGLPPGYTPLYAVDFEGGYIDTEFTFTMDCVLTCVARIKTASVALNGAYAEDRTVQFGRSTNGKLTAYLGSSIAGLTDTSDYHFFVIDGPARQGSVDGSSTQGELPTDFEPTTLAMALGGRRSGSNVAANSGVLIKIFEVTRGGRKIIDMVPALDASGVVCMYDRVRKKTYYSANGKPINPILNE